MNTIFSFDPVVNRQCKILILGSMPGKESLRKRQYYGHAQNTFWRLMSALLNEPMYEDYDKRLHMLLRHGIALWDVIKSCERKSSLDADIKNATVNDFTAFFASYPEIRHVFFNGHMAYDIFAKQTGFKFEKKFFERLGSTSPAHAIPFGIRLEEWKRILFF